jgi:hypothetical protein
MAVGYGFPMIRPTSPTTPYVNPVGRTGEISTLHAKFPMFGPTLAEKSTLLYPDEIVVTDPG